MNTSIDAGNPANLCMLCRNVIGESNVSFYNNSFNDLIYPGESYYGDTCLNGCCEVIFANKLSIKKWFEGATATIRDMSKLAEQKHISIISASELRK